MQRDLNQLEKVKKNNPYAIMKEMLMDLYGLELSDTKKGNFRFPIYLSDKLKDMPVETLEISERGRNCLRRAGYKTLYDLFDNIQGKKDLESIRCCGTGTAQEIIEKIFIFQYNSLSESRKKKFISRIVELNVE